jgi:tRNA1Val (adenine37-N6)-methyltransferase
MVFKFKEFIVKQDKAAMKIGTDAVLLGAWTRINKPINSVLDIGAGTGVIALQMAQLYDAEIIDAIEIEPNAYEQCVDNFENSPWADRLFCYHSSLQKFALEMDDKYDLIISNPPFYTDTFYSDNVDRNQARQTLSLSFGELLSSVYKLLNKNGYFSVIIPFKEEDLFIKLACEFQLFPQKITRVRGNENSQIKRSLILFSDNIKSETFIDELVLEKERHIYTESYKKLVDEFYL